MKVLKCFHDTGHEKSSGGIIKTSPVPIKKKTKTKTEKETFGEKNTSRKCIFVNVLFIQILLREGSNLKIQREITASIIEKVLMTPKSVSSTLSEIMLLRIN